MLMLKKQKQKEEKESSEDDISNLNQKRTEGEEEKNTLKNFLMTKFLLFGMELSKIFLMNLLQLLKKCCLLKARSSVRWSLTHQ